MQVILLEQIKRLGSIGDIVKVKGGYARNYLIPNKKALRATKDNVAYFEAKKSEIESENKKKLSQAEELSKKIDSAVVTIIQQAGDDGRLFGSVTISDIAKALKEDTKTEVDREHINLHNPIKYIGIHTVEVTPHAEVSVNIFVNVARSEDEAKDASARHARGEIVMEGPEGELARNKASAAAEAVTSVPVSKTATQKNEEKAAAEPTEKSEKKSEKKTRKSAKKAEEVKE